MVYDLKSSMDASGLADNSGTYIYSWAYEMIFIEPNFDAFRGHDPALARQVHRQIVKGVGSRFLDEFMPIWLWKGSGNFQPLNGKRVKIPQCIHIRPGHWFVYMDGPKPVKVTDINCILERK